MKVRLISYDNMGDTGGHGDKWNEIDTEGQTL
jgi:hypothetical protein